MQTNKKPAQKLILSSRTLALAESCTGGLLSHILTNTPGASGFYHLGIIAYDNKAKTTLLKVPSPLLKKHGAVSCQVALLMAKNVRKILHTDLGLAITGIAGPGGGSTAKPVGLVYIALADKNKAQAFEYRFKGSRLQIKEQAAQKALDILNN